MKTRRIVVHSNNGSTEQSTLTTLPLKPLRGSQSSWSAALSIPSLSLGALLSCQGITNVQAQPSSCGEPPLLAESEAAVLLWQDCGTGTWQMRATAGGSPATVTYEGTVTSDQPFTAVDPVRVEEGDLLDTPSDEQIVFNLKVQGKWHDGLSFMFPENAEVCFRLDTPGAALLVGTDRTPVSSDINLATLRPCGASLACGAPDIDASSDSGLWLWQNCDSGNWEMRATGGGSRSFSSYEGKVSSESTITELQTVALEKGGAYEDTVSATTETTIDFRLNVTGIYEDGFIFGNDNLGGFCVNLDPPGSPIFVGPDGVATATPLNLSDLGSCASEPVAIDPPTEPPIVPPETEDEVPHYLEDGEYIDRTTRRGRSIVDEIPFPRIQAGQALSIGDGESDSKYDIVAVRGNDLNQIERVQAINPDFIALRLMSPMAYQGYDRTDPCTFEAGMPFGGTGPATRGCDVFAGHWLYKPGTRLTSAVSASATQILVQDASSFGAGEYVVIYDGPAGSFNNAEHARITSVSRSTNTLTVARGYKSKASSHSPGAIVAAHVLGQGTNKLLWAWNQSSTCPKDANGRRLNQALADWLAANYDKDKDGKPLNANIDGVLYDADFHFLVEAGGKGADVDNDLIMDDGVSPSGINYWGEGMEAFYEGVRSRQPDILTVGGVASARGFLHNNGAQLEGFPGRGDSKAVDPDYSAVDTALSRAAAQMHHGVDSPRYIETMFKHPTKIYPMDSKTPPTSNAAFRFSFAMTLLEGGYFGHHRGLGVADPWFDEYSVDVQPGSRNFGRAVKSDPKDESLVRLHRHWLGFPIGPRYRVYDAEVFSADKSLIATGSFDDGIQGWSGTNVAVSHDQSAEGHLDGAGALHSGPQIRYGVDWVSAKIVGPKAALTAGKEYTLVFSAKATEHRQIRSNVGGNSEIFQITPNWTRHVMTFVAGTTKNHILSFDVGRDSTPVWIDSVHLFEGNADVFRRDFDGGIVVVNATDRERTVDLGETFQRIQGTGQDPINNGEKLRSVRISPWDAAILVRLP